MIVAVIFRQLRISGNIGNPDFGNDDRELQLVGVEIRTLDSHVPNNNNNLKRPALPGFFAFERDAKTRSVPPNRCQSLPYRNRTALAPSRRAQLAGALVNQ
ncbi:hypothetical protein AB9E30_28245 [Rhizobium leguminosarum]